MSIPTGSKASNTPSTISVVISSYELISLGRVTDDFHIVARLKAAGIPGRGTSMFTGLEHGVLT